MADNDPGGCKTDYAIGLGGAAGAGYAMNNAAVHPNEYSLSSKDDRRRNMKEYEIFQKTNTNRDENRNKKSQLTAISGTYIALMFDR